MSNASTKHRPLADIQQEFSQQCAIAGQTLYQIDCLQRDVVKMNARLRELTKEAETSKKLENLVAPAPPSAEIEAPAVEVPEQNNQQPETQSVQ